MTREDVVIAFELLLGRAPESEATIDAHRGLPDRRALGEVILRSPECRLIHGSDWPMREAPRRADGTPLATWRFGRDGNAGPALREGLAVPDLHACWTTGDASRLVLPIPEAPPGCDLALTITLASFHQAQRLALSVQGRELVACVVRGATALAVRVPAALLDGQSTLALTLQHPDTVRPCDVSASPDDRTLGFAVQSVELATLPRAAAEPAAADVLQHFQNLGENCEFGFLLQRFAGGGGGLLRFSGLPYDQLLRGIATRFEGFPDRARMHVERHTTRTGGIEAMVVEDGFSFLTHTGIANEALQQLNDATLLDREARRLGWLRRLFVEELEEGLTVFVYRTHPARSHAEMMALWLAMRRLGGCALLWVVEAEAGLPAGSVLVLGEGFLKGFIERLASSDNTEDLHLEGWLALCHRALRLVRNEDGEPGAGWSG